MTRKHVAMGWYTRGYQPHLDAPGATQFVTFRLADSVPAELLQRWRQALRQSDADTARRALVLQRRIEHYADAGFGACHLHRPDVARIVRRAFEHRDGSAYHLQAWCIMPNHVHVLLQQRQHGPPLPKIIQSWKSWSATTINRVLQRRGTLWMRDYFDRYVRDDAHLQACRHYICHNPVKAGLVRRAGDWPWTWVK